MNLNKNISEEDAHSVVINIPKARLPDKKSIGVLIKREPKRIVRKTKRKPSETDIMKYSLPGGLPLPVKTLKNDELLLSYRLFAKNQEKERSKYHLGIKSRDYYKVISTDLQKRLHTDDPPDEYHTIVDVDPEFFLCVNGSSLAKYAPPFKSLKHIFSSQLRLRQEVGYRNDCILNIETNNSKEQIVHNKSIERYKEQVKHFDRFISDDYQKSMEFLNRWEEVKTKVMEKISELQNLAMEKFTITSRLVGLDYRYGLQQKYGRFFYYLSPPSWRSKNRTFARSVEIEAKGFDFGNSSEEDTFNVIFEKLQKECSDGLVKPVLYFTEPAGLMEIFEGIEQQQLHHFTHVTQLAPHAKLLKHGIKYIKDIITQDTAGIDTTIKDFEKHLEFCEERSNQLEAKFFKIINGMFYDKVGAPEVLKFQHHLEYCYERVCNEKPINMDIVAIGRAIENVYMDYTRRLDAVTGNKIRQALNQYIESEKRKFKKAKIAARELLLFEGLERALLRAHAPIATKKSVVSLKAPHIRSASRKQYSKLKTAETNRQSLTEEAKEYLTLFTDWTEKEDPANYLQCLNMSQDKT